MYIDRDCFIINDIAPLVDLANQYGRVLFKNVVINHVHTKRDLFILMGADNEKIHNMELISAGNILLKNTASNRQFIKEWLRYSTDSRLITDSPSILAEELPGFTGHQHDQSILTVLSTRYEDGQIVLSKQEEDKYIINTNNRNRNMFICTQNRRYQK